MIDEHRISCDHHYAVTIYDAKTFVLLYVCEGRKIENIQPFFARLKECGVAEKITTVSCDCAAGFSNMVKDNLPNAKVVLDQLF